MLPGCQPKGEDVLHLVVVLDGCVEELRVFGVILRKKHTVVSREKAMVDRFKQEGRELIAVWPV